MDEIIALKKKLGIGSVSKLKTQLEGALAQKSNIIDASAVEYVDTIGLQLLIVFIKESLRQNINIVVQNPSNVFKDAILTLGLKNTFTLMDANND